MKAVYREKYGHSETLSVIDIEKPVPTKNQILVKVEAATVNRTDCEIMKSNKAIMRLVYGLTSPKVKIPGTDFAGTIEAVGENVTTFSVGEKVFGFNDMGVQSHAEYLLIEEKGTIQRVPETCSTEDAAALIEGCHYAINFMNKVAVQAGDRVLVHGAAGAIGSAAIQLLKIEGAVITAVTETKSIDLVKELGAETVIDFTKEDFTQLDGEFDFIFDTVGKSSFGACKHLLTPKGTYISSELGPRNENPFLAVFTPLFGKRTVKFPVPFSIQESLKRVAEHLQSGTLRPVIDRRYSIEEIRDAVEYVDSAQKTGAVILTLGLK